jgi:hypothetical protein
MAHKGTLFLDEVGEIPAGEKLTFTPGGEAKIN